MKSHQRKLVDVSILTYSDKVASIIPPAEAGGYFNPDLRPRQAGLEQSTTCRWWDSEKFKPVFVGRA
jgi:hypothetical protein